MFSLMRITLKIIFAKIVPKTISSLLSSYRAKMPTKRIKSISPIEKQISRFNCNQLIVLENERTSKRNAISGPRRTQQTSIASRVRHVSPVNLCSILLFLLAV